MLDRPLLTRRDLQIAFKLSSAQLRSVLDSPGFPPPVKVADRLRG